MKQLFDYLPVIAFFGLYFASGRDIYIATWGILIACTLQVTLGWLIWRKLEKMHWAVFLITLVFGGLTLLLRDDTFIKWRPSIINLLFSIILFGGHFLKRNLIQRLLEALMVKATGGPITLLAVQWRIINICFVGYFAFVALLNLYVAYSFSTDFWVLFKAIGFSIISIFFYGGMFGYIYHCMPEEQRARLFQDKTAQDNSAGQPSTHNKPTPPSEPLDDKTDAVRDHQ
ncbi:MAG: septation protein A [Gammaproteobacteria bacterium HGW-Gammaproteobacteria-14]|nr:MAG: septation protein A [Gammaproteobacteria bacterium HGW-Gammaproteobacteria-14]